jgi:hypothetical protein
MEGIAPPMEICSKKLDSRHVKLLFIPLAGRNLDR